MVAIPWLADVLRDAGVAVVEYPGWRDRSYVGAFNPRAVMWHHDASTMGPSPSFARLIAEGGNATTPPPLAHCWVNTFGTWFVLAGAGRANHAGLGEGWGVVRANRGNEDAIGVETDHTIGEPWPSAQLDSLRLGSRAILDRLGARPHDALVGHKEYAPGRKPDPDGLNMDTERLVLLEDDVLTQEEVRRIAIAVLDVDLGGGWTLADAARSWAPGVPNVRNGGVNFALLGESLAAARDDLNAEEVVNKLESAVRDSTRTAVVDVVLPAVQRIESALARDDSDEAKAIVTELASRLNAVA